MSREVMQQALEALEILDKVMQRSPRTESAITALRQALAEPEQPVAINWTLNGDSCGYDNWLGETPFGRILITWKSWKEFPEASVDEFPGDFTAYGKPDDVKDECEAEFRRRLGAAPTPRKPLTVPEGYALISIDALKAWGKYDEVLAACQYGITGEQT